MHITAIPVSSVLDFEIGVKKSSGGVRSPGLHLSTIYGLLLKELYPERYERFEGRPETLELFGEVGFAAEHIIERGFKARHTERPEEQITEEGIYFSPDGLLFEDEPNELVRVVELKATWMSSREVPQVGALAGFGSFPPKFDKYFIQVKGYCRAMGTPHALLVVLFVNGPYDCKNRQELAPEIHCWKLTFTPQELEDNWRMLMNFAREKGFLDANGRAVSSERVVAILTGVGEDPKRHDEKSRHPRDSSVARTSATQTSPGTQRPPAPGASRRSARTQGARRP